MSVPVDAVRIERATNLAGEPRDTLVFDAVRVPDAASAAPGVDPPALRYRGALSRVAVMAGALERMSEITQEYTRDRRQFRKPVASFQAVQEHLVHAAQDAVIVAMAAATSARAGNSRRRPLRDRGGQAPRQPGGNVGHARRASGARRDGDDAASTRCTTSAGACGRGAASTATSGTGAELSERRW